MDYLNTYKRLLALADAGLFYGKDAFDQERYQELRELTLQLISTTGHEAAVLPDLEKILTKEEGYPTPKVDVRGLIKKENRFLLVEDLRTKEWSLPGGYAEIGCSPKENIEKEPLAKIDYVEMVDFNQLETLEKVQKPLLCAMAVYIGKTRLIDNFIME